MQRKNSLVYRVLCHKYFRNKDRGEASISSTASYVWLSLLMGKEVVDAGLIWRIGNG